MLAGGLDRAASVEQSRRAPRTRRRATTPPRWSTSAPVGRQEALTELRAALRLNRNYLPSLVQMADLLSASDRVFEAYGVLQHAVAIAPRSARGPCPARSLLLAPGSAEGGAARSSLRAIELDPRLERALPRPGHRGEAPGPPRGRPPARRDVPRALTGRRGGAGAARGNLLRDGGLRRLRSPPTATCRRRPPEDGKFSREIARTLLAAGRYEEAEQAFRALTRTRPADREALRGVYERELQARRLPAGRRGARAAGEARAEELRAPAPSLAHVPARWADRRRRGSGRRACLRARARPFRRALPDRLDVAGRGRPGQGESGVRGRRCRATRTPRDALYRLATVELRLGNRPAALRLLEKAVAVDPDYTSARYELAQALHRRGSRRRCREAVRGVPPPEGPRGLEGRRRRAADGAATSRTGSASPPTCSGRRSPARPWRSWSRRGRRRPRTPR